MDLVVESTFEGRSFPQLSSFIEKQLRRWVRQKHTLPARKTRWGLLSSLPPVLSPHARPLSTDLSLSSSSPSHRASLTRYPISLLPSPPHPTPHTPLLTPPHLTPQSSPSDLSHPHSSPSFLTRCMYMIGG